MTTETARNNLKTSAVEAGSTTPSSDLSVDTALHSPDRAELLLHEPIEEVCMPVTAAELDSLLDLIARSREKASADNLAHGVSGAYASAARDNLAMLTRAYEKLRYLQSWFLDHRISSPYRDTTSTSNIHNYVRDLVHLLQYARHWASISVVYHCSTDARDSFELTTQAILFAEDLGVRAGRCYIGAYYPACLTRRPA